MSILRPVKYKILTFLLIFVSSVAFGSECIDWQRLRSEYFPQASKKINEKKLKTIVVQPFTNYTKQKGDDWLVIGARDLLSDMLEAGGRDLLVYSGLSAIYQEKAKYPNYLIKGMFQRKNEYLRMFIFLNDGQTGQLIKQFSYSVFYPQDADFFQSLGKTASAIIELIDSKVNSDAIKQVVNASTVPLSFASYSMGMQVMSSGNLKDVETALDFFNEAKRLDPKALWPYLGSIDTFAFAALRSKLTNRAFGPYLEQMEAEINGLKKTKKSFPINRWAISFDEEGAKSRFSINQGSFIAGLYAAQEGKLQEAANNLQSAVNAVPEDAVSWGHLSRIYASLGNVLGSEQAASMANRINSCSPHIQVPEQTAPSPVQNYPTQTSQDTNTQIITPSTQGSSVKPIKRSWGD